MMYKLPASQNLLTPAAVAHIMRNSLLTPAESNTKTAKLQKELGIYSAVLHLAPSWNSGYQLCPMASTGCASACLYTAGRASFEPKINQARIRKTRYFIEEHDAFMAKLVHEIQLHVKRAMRVGRMPTLRLNATSDIPWEHVPAVVDGIAYDNLMTAFPMVTFYDYTKVITRLRRELPGNYSLTFSLAESNQKHAAEAIARGFNVAAVLRVRKRVAMPASFLGLPVVDGDTHDYRFLDRRGAIVGLRPKGQALKDTSGFVYDPDATLDSTQQPAFATRPMLALQAVA